MEYFVSGNLRHNGRKYKRGDTIALGDGAAAPLLQAGVIQTEPLSDAPDVTPPVAEPPTQPVVSGTPVQTGEPSIDGRQDPERRVDNAQDVTPPVDTGMRALSPDVRAAAPNAPQQSSEAPTEPSEDMKREQLEELAVSEGISEQDAVNAPNKGALVELILKHRKGEPERDPSAGL
jgi:hypothetical protein